MFSTITTVVYEYANGVRMYALCRTQNGCYEDNSAASILGPRDAVISHAVPHRGRKQVELPGPSEQSLRTGTQGPVRGHSLRQAVNCGDYMARSTLVAVMGQLACYSGKELTWEQVAKSDFVFHPEGRRRSARHGAAGETGRERLVSRADAGHHGVQDLAGGRFSVGPAVQLPPQPESSHRVTQCSSVRSAVDLVVIFPKPRNPFDEL